MAREGYHLADNQIEPASLATDGSSTSQQPTVTTTSETVELPPPIPIPGQAPCMLGPMSSMSGLNPCQLPSQCNFSGAHLLPPGNIHSTPHLSAGYLSKPQLDFAPQLNPLHPQWQHVIDKRAFLQFQMLQRLGLQWQLLQKRMMTGGLGAATGCSSMMQLGSGAEWLGNIGLGSSDNVLGMRGSTPVLMRENIPRIGNSGEGNIPAAVLARMRMAENQGRALWSEVPIQRNPGILPAYQPNFSAMAYEGINQQMSLLQIRQQLYVLPQQQQHEMGSPIQSTGGTGLAEHVVSPPSQVGRHQMDQMSPHQLNSVMVPQKVDPGNVVADHENPGISSRTLGSVASYKASSSMELRDPIKDAT
ncbi:uncharacterized protein LOC132305557 [Cornus florida]|uniref:uncharacterized protein LOC132305557 n=1 Tax=Cornus florida TaxID=4283 RepID=UPI00289BE129|nr:uncharacterized protein LOC132305557 [Cornus florida]